MPRFAAVQNGAWRAVDKGSAFGQNSTVGVPWKLTLGGIDELAVVAVAWLRAIKPDRNR